MNLNEVFFNELVTRPGFCFMRMGFESDFVAAVGFFENLTLEICVNVT